MIANNINGTIKVFNSIPKVFELKPNIFGYDKLDTSVHYADGFRELITPTLEENQYLTTIYFDDKEDIFTYNVETYTPEEIRLKENDDEYIKYLNRVAVGKDRYLKLCGEFRVSRDKGEISQEFYELLEDTLEPIRTEIVNGQFITAKRKLIVIGSELITEQFYNRFLNTIEQDIEELY